MEERHQLAGGPVSIWQQSGKAVIHHAAGLSIELAPREQADLFVWLSGQVVKAGLMAVGTPGGQAVTIAQTWGMGQWTRMDATLYRGREVNGQRIAILDIPAYRGADEHPHRWVCLVRDATEDEKRAWRSSLFFVTTRSDTDQSPSQNPDRVVMPLDLSKSMLERDPLALAQFGLFLLVAYPELLQGNGSRP
jgi:hypothetical protein